MGSVGGVDDRPPPNPEKLLRQFRDWLEGTELPGRTMSYLKTGFLPEVLSERSSSESLSAMTEAWQRWEDGATNPSAVLEVLRDNDLEELLAELAS